ncbi:hypothetical protein Bca52824_039158 [Brassica carinata]|uniref:Uncharacterized protein n=1 Tax=Brassica carinata TaxID=52824 RepID=A0A8X7RNT9_BRACI|nr:hypothetical protein Bca52824_039158 [Brassica carinata]
MPRARLSASNRRHNRRLWPPSTFQTRLKPHSLQIEDPMTPTAVNLVEHEGQMIASPPAIVSPPASGPLAVKEDACDITVEEEAVDEHEIDEESPDDDSDKGPTFEPLDSNEKIPVVDIVTLVQNSANTLVDHLDRKSCSPLAHQAHETLGESSIATPSEVAIATPFTESHEGIGDPHR